MQTCKFCQSAKIVKHGARAGIQRYRCNECNHHFYATQATFARMRVNEHIIVTALNLYYEGLSTRKVQKQLSDIYGEEVSASTVWYWVSKFGQLAGEYTKTLMPKLGGKYHHDETAIRVGGEEKWFWEMIDSDTRYLVASHLSNTRTHEDAVAVFKQALEKQRPIALFTDGSFAYDEAFKKVFYSRYRTKQVEWVRRVGIQARQTNNIVERLHGTLKDRLRPMRGLKHTHTAKRLLNGYVAHYNFCRTHSSIGTTPAQAAGLEVKGWKQLIEKAQAVKTTEEVQQKQAIEVEVRTR